MMINSQLLFESINWQEPVTIEMSRMTFTNDVGVIKIEISVNFLGMISVKATVNNTTFINRTVVKDDLKELNLLYQRIRVRLLEDGHESNNTLLRQMRRYKIGIDK